MKPFRYRCLLRGPRKSCDTCEVKEERYHSSNSLRGYGRVNMHPIRSDDPLNCEWYDSINYACMFYVVNLLCRHVTYRRIA